MFAPPSLRSGALTGTEVRRLVEPGPTARRTAPTTGAAA